MKKAKKTATAFSWASTALGGISIALSFVPYIGAPLSLAVSTISLHTSLLAMLIGDGVEISDGMIEKQIAFFKRGLR